jgi:hypothetical protein
MEFSLELKLNKQFPMLVRNVLFANGRKQRNEIPGKSEGRKKESKKHIGTLGKIVSPS